MAFKRKHVVNGCFISVFISAFCLQKEGSFFSQPMRFDSFIFDETTKKQTVEETILFVCCVVRKFITKIVLHVPQNRLNDINLSHYI